MSANYLFHNLGGFRFEEIGQLSGAAASAEGGYKAGMGIACGDLDGDGRPDLAVTNYFGESTTFYQNLGRGHSSPTIPRDRHGCSDSPVAGLWSRFRRRQQ